MTRTLKVPVGLQLSVDAQHVRRCPVTTHASNASGNNNHPLLLMKAFSWSRTVTWRIACNRLQKPELKLYLCDKNQSSADIRLFGI